MSQQTLVGLRPGLRCSEAVQFSTLTTKLFFLSFLCCSQPSSCSQAWRRHFTLAPRGLGPTSTVSFQYYALPPLQSYFLCTLWVLSTNSRRGMDIVHCIYKLLLSPTHSSGCLWPDRFLALFLSLFCCLWIGERTTPNLLFLRVVADPLNLRANEIVAGKLYHLIILCPSQVQLTAFLEVRNGAQMKRNMFFIFIFKHHYPPHPPLFRTFTHPQERER